MKYNLFAEKHYSFREAIKETEIASKCNPVIRKKCNTFDEAVSVSTKEGNWIIEEDGVFNVYSTSEGHATIFRYDDEILSYMKSKKGSIEGFDGKAYTDWFYMDFDKRGDREICLIAISPLLDYLKENAIENFLFNSGVKGFHLYIPIEYFKFDNEHLDKADRVCKHIFEQLCKQFPTIVSVADPGIYTKCHLMRLPFALNRNKKPPKVKTLLTWKGMDEKKPFMEWFDIEKTDKATVNFIKSKLFSSIKIKDTHWNIDFKLQLPQITRSKSVEGFKFPYGGKACIYAMQEEKEPKERHNTAMRMMIHWKEQGLPETVIYDILKDWRNGISNNSDYKEKELVRVMNSYNSDYKYNCSDYIKNRYCVKNNTCNFYKLSRNENTSCSSKHALAEYLEQMKESTGTHVKMDSIFDLMRFTLIPSRGHILTIVGASGVGKTILALIIMLKANNINWLFFSYEMGRGEITSRFATMLGLNLSLPDDRKKYLHLTGHIFVSDDQTISIQEQKFVKRATEARVGKKIHGLVSDYVQQIPVQDINNPKVYVSNPTQKVTDISRVAKKDAKDEGVIHIFCAQPTKEMSQNGNTELTEEDARDGQAVQAMSDGILTAWRPNRKRRAPINDTTAINRMIPDTVMTLSLCKWRHGMADFTHDYNWIPNMLKVEGLYLGKVNQLKRKEPGR